MRTFKDSPVRLRRKRTKRGFFIPFSTDKRRRFSPLTLAVEDFFMS